MNADKALMEDKTFYYDICKFEAMAQAQRNNVLLVFHSMLFAATAVLAHADSAVPQTPFFPLWLPMFVGLVLSMLWLYMNSLTYVLEKRAWNALLAKDERIRDLEIAWRQAWLHRLGLSMKLGVSSISAFVIPSLMLLSWLGIVFFYLAYEG